MSVMNMRALLHELPPAILGLFHRHRGHVLVAMEDELNGGDVDRVDVDIEVARLTVEELRRHVIEGGLQDAHCLRISRARSRTTTASSSL